MAEATGPGRAFTDGETLGSARRWLREQVKRDGAACPCCSQFAKVYRRGLSSPMALALITAWRRHGYGPWHLPTLFGASGDVAKLKYWGFIEPATDELRDDGSPRNGWWQITEAGAGWVQGHDTVPRYAFVFDGRCLGLDTKDPDAQRWSVAQALGKKFNYAELMNDPARVDGPVFEEIGGSHGPR